MKYHYYYNYNYYASSLIFLLPLCILFAGPTASLKSANNDLCKNYLSSIPLSIQAGDTLEFYVATSIRVPKRQSNPHIVLKLTSLSSKKSWLIGGKTPLTKSKVKIDFALPFTFAFTGNTEVFHLTMELDDNPKLICSQPITINNQNYENGKIMYFNLL